MNIGDMVLAVHAACLGYNIGYTWRSCIHNDHNRQMIMTDTLYTRCHRHIIFSNMTNLNVNLVELYLFSPPYTLQKFTLFFFIWLELQIRLGVCLIYPTENVNNALCQEGGVSAIIRDDDLAVIWPYSLIVTDTYDTIFPRDDHCHVDTVAASFKFVYKHWFSDISNWFSSGWLDFSRHFVFVTWCCLQDSSLVQARRMLTGAKIKSSI